nr:MAG TPA: hypothetical protein [Caudoviricetes sp.]
MKPPPRLAEGAFFCYIVIVPGEMRTDRQIPCW